MRATQYPPDAEKFAADPMRGGYWVARTRGSPSRERNGVPGRAMTLPRVHPSSISARLLRQMERYWIGHQGGNDDVCRHELLGRADGGGRRLDARGAGVLGAGKAVDGRRRRGECRNAREHELPARLPALRDRL